MLDAPMLRRLWPDAPGAFVDTIAAQAPSVLTKHRIDTPLRLAHFMAQISAETGGGTALEENLHYDIARIMVIWPKRFRTRGAAKAYAGRPRKLANALYNGRFGNRKNSDDGWTFRGRGLIQITGRYTYQNVGRVAGLDLEAKPDLASSPEHALTVAAAYWSWRKVNRPADADDLAAVTLLVTGGSTNFAPRQLWLTRWRAEIDGSLSRQAEPPAQPSSHRSPSLWQRLRTWLMKGAQHA